MQDKMESKYQQKPHFSEFNMALFDLERFNTILQTLDDLAWKVAIQDVSSIQCLIPYWAAQYVFYINIRSAIFKDNRKTFDEAFINIMQDINISKSKSAGKHVDTTAHRQLLELHTNLMEMRQLLGLSFPLGEKITSKERLKKMIDSTQGVPGA